MRTSKKILKGDEFMAKSQKCMYIVLVKRMFVLIMASILTLGACFEGQNSFPHEDSQEEQEGPDPSQTKKWTFMFYDDADFNNAYDPFEDFSMTSGENLDVVVLQDKKGSPTYLWYFNKNGKKVKLRELQDFNMGDYQSLWYLLNFSKANCPADRYILSFYDHGAGWAGACVDVTSNYDWLSMDEMQKALRETAGVDLVFFSAPCLMGAVESVYELRDCTDVYIGSESGSGYLWWMYAMGDIRILLNNTPDIDSYTLAEKVIEYILDNSNWWEEYKHNLTMSAIRTDKISALKNALDELSVDYLLRMGDFSSHIDSLYKNIISYSYSIDIYNFAEKFLTLETDAQTRTTLYNVQECLKDSVIAECHGESMEGSHGLSIYFPDPSEGNYNYLYGSLDYGLDFSEDTHWDDLLAIYFGPGKSMMDLFNLEVLKFPLFNPPNKNKY
jgi:hypothetical protein